MKAMLLCAMAAGAAALAGCDRPHFTDYNIDGYRLAVGGWTEDSPYPASGLRQSSRPNLAMDTVQAGEFGTSRQVMIEVKFVEVSPDFARVLGVELWDGDERRIPPVSQATLIKRTAPMNLALGGGVGTAHRDGSNAGHPSGCTCGQCRARRADPVTHPAGCACDLCRGGGGRTSTRTSVGGGVGTTTVGGQITSSGLRGTFVDKALNGSLDGMFVFVLTRTVDPLTGQINIRPVLLPVVATAEPKVERDIDKSRPATAVQIGDGGTVLLGGLDRNTGEQVDANEVPMLSKLPIINRLFRNRSGLGRERELQMFVTPRIIIQEEEEEQ